MRRLLFFLVLWPLAGRAAEPLPGHSVHGEAFDEGPRQAAVLMEGCGKVSLKITSAEATAQSFFNQGLGQLHGFWYFEAERSFRQVAALDPACAMAFWGCAMANVNNEKRAAGFIAEAMKLKDKASKREQAWITALEAFYHDLKKEKKSRQMDLIKDLEGIIHDFPEELEAKAFLAWAIWHAKEDGVPMVSRESVTALIQQVFAKEPMHPAHHYIIHLWDDSKPARAVASAAQCGQSAPAIAHMWHMPGHTFSKVDRLDDAAWQQEAATRVDHAYMISTRILPDQIHNYAHNTEWLIRTLNQTGKAREGIAIAKNLIEIPRHPVWNSVEKQGDSAAYGRTRLLETMLKFELWDDILALNDSPYLDVTQNPSYEANRLRAMGIASFFKGDSAMLDKHLAALQTLKDKPPAPPAKPADADKKPADAARPVPVVAKVETPAKPDENPAASEADNEAETKPEPPAKPAVANVPVKPTPKDTSAKPAPKRGNGGADQAFAELKALQAILKADNNAEATKLLEAAKDTPKDRLIRYHLKLANKDKAAGLAKDLPNDAPGLAQRVDTLWQCEKRDDAKAAFEKLRKAGASLDADLPVSARLDAIADELKTPKPWRAALVVAKDSGVRPTLDSLGPLHWHPFPAEPFSLPDSKNQPVALKDFKGKPVVVLFYLGHGCDHCVAQLKAFAAISDDFTKAGISIVAIGTEDVKGLTETQTFCDAQKGLPFPVLADAEANVFKQWRCYDDFEKTALHGAFLVDPKGEIRWLDVSYEPFKDSKFVLGEAKRLLRF